MSRLHGLVISLVLTACVVAGAAAATKTVHLGQSPATPPHVPDAVVAARRAKLDRFDRSLRGARGAQPPALPPVPRFAPVVIPPAPAVEAAPTLAASAEEHASAAPQAAVKLVQPPPVVQYVQPSGQPAPLSATHGDEGEAEDGGGGDD